ncbi:MAG TPA: RpiB/LacA/LacB family sugar-phosphate isomerase [Patescibacteria group bacterium]|jgi:ribose 5-phosphate isomerase B|nr:RpiB/LacA/LacB family sugar-phosphate isomerase [Patescibacteria group bacterium]
MRIYLGADHGGFKLKEEIKEWLKEWNFEFQDLGAQSFVSDDDYPDYAWPVAVKVGSEPMTFGILACRSGQGESIVANKAKGARAALAWNEKTAIAARNDDDANILCLPADYISLPEAKKIVHAFLTTPFGKDERYRRRTDKVKKIDINL